MQEPYDLAVTFLDIYPRDVRLTFIQKPVHEGLEQLSS